MVSSIFSAISASRHSIFALAIASLLFVFSSSNSWACSVVVFSGFGSVQGSTCNDNTPATAPAPPPAPAPVSPPSSSPTTPVSAPNPPSSVSNGQCGSANNTTVTVPPSTNLCSTGTPTAVTSDGPAYIWQCVGTGGGDTDGCVAFLASNNTNNSGNSGQSSNNTNPVITGPVSVNPVAGFVITSTNQVWNMRGLNAGVQDALNGYPQVMKDYPGLTAIRLNVNPNTDDIMAIAQVVQEYNASNVVVEIEDHVGSNNEDNVGWYQQIATLFNGFPLVFLETPNEPKNTMSVTVGNQTGIINAIRAVGFKNPIGIQPLQGYDKSNIPAVVAALGTSQLYVTPHIYYSGTDPNAAAEWTQQEIQGALANGLFVSIDEFGNAMDGVTMDPQGQTVIQAVTAANKAGQCGALFWAMDNGNHSDGANSAFPGSKRQSINIDRE